MPAGEVDLTIEKIADGEVSPYFHDTVVVGDRVEVRGPIGGYFVWEPALGGPLLLIAGGSGVVPLMAMLRERAAANSASNSTRMAECSITLPSAFSAFSQSHRKQTNFHGTVSLSVTLVSRWRSKAT